MKRIYILLLFAMPLVAWGQRDIEGWTCCKQDDWDWTDKLAQNWAADVAGYSATQSLGSPFDPQNPSASIPVFDNILRAQDFGPAKGWRLVQKNFGCAGSVEWPWFMLYNKYTGSLRLFVWTGVRGMENAAVFEINWADNSGRTLAVPADYGSLPATGSGSSGKHFGENAQTNKLYGENIIHYVNTFYHSAWTMMDISLQFDPTIDPLGPSCQKQYWLQIYRHVSHKTTVLLHGETRDTTRAMQATVANAPRSTPKNGLAEFALQAKTMLDKAPSPATMDKFVAENITPEITKSYLAVQDLPSGKFQDKLSGFVLGISKLSSDESPFRQFLDKASKGASTVSSVIGIGLGIFDMFSGKATSEQASSPQPIIPMPTVSVGTLDLSGSITAKASKTPISIQLPGTTQNSYATGQSMYPAPLGVVAMEKEPQLQIRKWSSMYSPLRFNSNGGGSGGSAYSCYSCANAAQYGVTEDPAESMSWKSVRISAPPLFALNIYAQLKVKESKAMIVARMRTVPTATGSNPAYVLKRCANVPSYPYFYHNGITNLSGNGYSLIRKDLATDYISQGVYQINKLGKDGRIEFSTNPVNLTDIVGTAMTVREETDLFLKVMYILEPTEADADKTPVIMWQMYALTSDAETDVSKDEPYLFTYSQTETVEIQPELTVTGSLSNYTRIPSCITTPDGSDPCISNTLKLSDFAAGSVFRIGTTINGVMNPDKKISYSTNADIELLPGFEATPTANGSFDATITNLVTRVPASPTPLASMFVERDCKCPSSKYTPYTLKSDRHPDLPAKANTLPFQLSVHPNPASREIALSISGGDAHITISDMSGRSCMEWDAQAGNTTADVSALAQGVYIIQAVSAKGSASTRLIKQ